MQRTEMVEIHDHPRFPAVLRHLVTDALEALWQFGNSYRPILGRLHEGLAAKGESPVQVVDLCSGGGGPWARLANQLEDRYGCQVNVRLTDKYPNAEAFERIGTRYGTCSGAGRTGFTASRIAFSLNQVDALRVPAEMSGFRTMFSAFHHFGPANARRVLANAVESGQGIGIFEVARRGVGTLLVLCLTPILVLLLTPGMRPFRWSRLLWTYLIPVVPFVIGFDGWVSCFRAYSQVELQKMVEGMDSYQWEIGEERTGLLPVTYLVGLPRGDADRP